MARATIKLEFNAGDDIEGAFLEAIRIAKILKCLAEFNFNGFTCLAHPDSSVGEGVEIYLKEVEIYLKEVKNEYK